MIISEGGLVSLGMWKGCLIRTNVQGVSRLVSKFEIKIFLFYEGAN